MAEFIHFEAEIEDVNSSDNDEKMILFLKFPLLMTLK